MSAIDDLLSIIAAYSRARGLSESRVSTLCFGEGTRVRHLRAGGEMGALRVARAVQWFSDNWPDGVEWPGQIERPRGSPLAKAAS